MITVAWIGNLDADLELVDPDAYAPSGRVLEHTRAIAAQWVRSANVATPGVRHVLLSEECRADAYQAWCPTPRAHAIARSADRRLPEAPPLEVIRRVNHRAFAAELGLGLEGSVFVASMRDFDECMRAKPPVGGWLLKRPFGFSGRGQKHLCAAPSGSDRRWVEASMCGYGRGLVVEPFVAIEREFALHAWLARDGAVQVGEPTVLRTDACGAWIENERTSTLRESEFESLHRALDHVARSLAEAGYSGPFSIDAFRYRDEYGTECFCALSELNARYSMGFFVGFAGHALRWARWLGVVGDSG